MSPDETVQEDEGDYDAFQQDCGIVGLRIFLLLIHGVIIPAFERSRSPVNDWCRSRRIECPARLDGGGYQPPPSARYELTADRAASARVRARSSWANSNWRSASSTSVSSMAPP